MPRYKDEPLAVHVYTVCDESKYLVVRNVPALGCGDELFKLFSTYGQVQECKPMDAEECQQYTDVYWIKFNQINNARFAKRKLDEYVYLGNRLQVSYAPQYETLSDTKEKLEWRTKEVLACLNPRKSKGASESTHVMNALPQTSCLSKRDLTRSQSETSSGQSSSMALVSPDKEYFPSESMNETVHMVREKLDKIQSSSGNRESGFSKRPRYDNRRRI